MSGSAIQTSFRPDVFDATACRLLGMACGDCGLVSFPARDSCPSCGSPENLEQRVLSRDGRVCSWAVVRNAPPGLLTPYVLAYVDLEEDGVRVMSRLEDVEPEALRVGMPVELTSLSVVSTRADDDVPDSVDVHMFAFRPVEHP
ncbi:Zn-ribbon domain-containing OB-fold protein [Aeromicrobium sp. CTD01-1L150]|uniref:Zn-ribbon domain-containing OB-fold protein n=1 Tax=Aeromicrobium sp. CTD01-1L150 TaxID=3341830 RepID=UPI0035C13D28